MQHLRRIIEQFQAQVQAQQPVAKVLVQQPASSMMLASGGGFKKGKNGLDLTDAGHQAENSLDEAPHLIHFFLSIGSYYYYSPFPLRIPRTRELRRFSGDPYFASLSSENANP